MLLAFVWLTIGTSFLSVEQQKQLNHKTTSSTESENAEKGSAPFENANEEKTENSPNTFSGEYLREDTEHFSSTDIPLKHNKCLFERIFRSLYNESVSQPPEIIFC
jgi:hypothetical protein